MSLQEQIADLTRRMNNGEYGYGHTQEEVSFTKARLAVLRAQLANAQATSVKPISVTHPSGIFASASFPSWPLFIAGGIFLLLLLTSRR